MEVMVFMLSRKNINEKLKRLEQQKQRFSIRKLTIGAASVLIGLVFFGMGSQSVHADTVTSPQVVKSTEVKVTQPSTNKNTNTVVKTSEQKATNETPSNVTKEAPKTSTPEVTTKANKVQESTISTDNQKNIQPSTPVKSVTPKSKSITSTQASPQTQATEVQVAAKTTTTPAAQSTISQTTEHVANETELQNALNNTNINNIVLDGNITNNSNSTFSLNNGTARQLTISGKQSDGTNASWNTGSGYVYLGSGTESNNKQWDISFEDIDITSTNSNGWSPVSLDNGVTGNISFNNVTNGGNGVLVYAPSANVTVQNTSSKPASSATDPNITANNVNIGDNVNLVTTQNNYNDGNVYANGNITVTGKNISLNSQADSNGSTSNAATNLYAGGNIDFKTGSDAILTAASSQSNNVNNLNINGTLTVEKDANVVVNSNVTANNVSTPTGFNSYSFPSGCSSITLVNNGAVIDGNLTINATAVPNSSGVVAGIGVQGSPSNAADVIIGSTGKYVVNATNSRDTRGIFYCADNHTVGLAEGAQAQFNMGHGVSNAIFRADNVILKPNASINITTYQDNNGNSNNGIQSDGAGDHSGPIVVGWSPTGSADNSSFVNNNTHATIEIDKDANLTIIRKTDSNSKQANSPLIDFGSNGSNGFSMNLTMNGGRMDLEDALQMDSHSGTPFDGSASYLGSEKEIFPMGMIVMFGTSSSDYVKITDPELFKMVRTGAQKGMLFRLEGTTNSINVASSDGEAIPLDYATVGGVKYSNGKVSTNTAYKWNITNLNTVNKMGNWAANYNNKGGSTSDAPDSWSEGVPFGEAQASVTFAPVALSDEPSDLSTPADFNNYFNWWSASNVAMGSDLIPDADKNDPKGGTITVNENAVLTPADAEQAITNKADLTNVSTYSWDKDATPSTAKPGTFDGKVIVTYADKSEDIVPVKVIVKSLADEYTPEGQTVNVKKGQTPDAEEGIKNTNELPKGTKYTWKTTPDTSTVGTKSATIVVTYPDGSKDEVPVKVVVTDNSQPSQQPDAEKYEPEGQTVNVKKGQTPDAEEGIKNTNELPKGTKYTWKTTPDTSTVGTKSATVVVTYPDGSKDEVPVKVVVTDNSQPAEKPDSEKYEPEGQTVNVKKGQTPSAEEGIKNTNDMPSGTKYTWKTTPDTSTVGTKSATIVVTYPDGSKDEVPVKVVVTDNSQPSQQPDAEKYEPEGQTVNVKKGQTPSAEEGIKNTNDMPSGTKYTWKTTPDTSTVGTKSATIVVTYPDGSKDEVPVKVVVTDNSQPSQQPDAEKYEPEGQTVNVKKGQTPSAEEGIKNTNDMPSGTKYTWKTTPDTSTVGTKSATIVVTYPDGSKDEVPVKVVVTDNSQPSQQPDAEKYEPEGQTVNVKKGQTPDAEEGIKNTNDMPSGTKYTWKTTPDTSTVGTKSATIVVTYPDGSKDEVPVKVVVTDNSQPSQQPDAEKYEPEGQTVNVKKGQTPSAEEGIKNTNDMPSGTKYTWKTTPDTSTVGTKSATIVVTYPDGSKDEVPVKVVVTKDQTQPVTPTTPEQPNTPETPTNTTKVIEPTNSDDPNQKDLFKHVTRTIIIKEPGKKAKKIIQTATFTRNKTINTVTGDVISYGKWTPSTRTLDKVPTPNVNGYSKHIDGDLNTIKVSPTSADTVVKVTYTRKPKATEQNTNDTNHSTHTTRVDTFNHESNKNSNSNNGFDYNNSPKSITIPLNNRSTDQIINWLRSTGYQVAVNSNGEITSIVKVNKNKVYNYTISPEGKLILTSITSLENSSKANNTMINSLSTSQNGKESQSTSMKELPQTGSKDDDLASIGLAMATISGLLGLIVDRKRKQQ